MKITSIDKYITAVPHIPEIQKSRPTDYQERPIPSAGAQTDGHQTLGSGAGGVELSGSG